MIAIVYPQLYGVGGIARYLDSFLSNLPPLQSPIILITGDRDVRPLQFAGVELHNVPLRSGRGGLAAWGIRVRRLLRVLHASGRINAVNLHWPPLVPGLFLPPEIPLILTAHTTYLGMSNRFYPEKYYQSQWSENSVRVKIWMENRILQRTRKVITLSEQGRQELLRYGFDREISVIPNGADTQTFHPRQPPASKDFDVLFSGRIETRKGSRPMVSVCKMLIERRPAVRICIVGYGEDDQWVQEQLGSTKQVSLKGKVPFDEMVGFYDRSHVYASTSYYEGLPGTCLEAMAMALPVVVWDFLFYKGLVEQAETGFVVAPNDFAGMTDGILQLLDKPATAVAIGKAARQRLQLKFDWKVLAAEICRELGAEPRP